MCTYIMTTFKKQEKLNMVILNILNLTKRGAFNNY